MSKTKHNLIVLATVLSPLWVGLLASIGQPSTSLAGLGVLGGAVLGIPVIAICGIVVSLLSRNSSNPYKISELGYGIPAILVCAYMLFVMFA